MTQTELINEVRDYVRDNISLFHDARINKLKTLQLTKLLKSKNPYLYKAKNLNTPGEIVQSIASAFISSAEESMFGDWLEGLAIFIAEKAYDGKKSTAEGIDLELDKVKDGNKTHYLISIKSGPKWSNSSSMKKLKENFTKAQRIFHTSKNRIPCEAIEGCCYGIDNNPEKATHTKLCGEKFWEFISGSNSMYLDIIEPLGINAMKRNQTYQEEYDKMITRFTIAFSKEYCNEEGDILWEKIVKQNSGHKEKSDKKD